ncbi:MAG: histone family protein DNA-binding protein [Frankiales bacterium]|nr:histone family protein DNA-binding protein [Frankiales bacterium]
MNKAELIGAVAAQVGDKRTSEECVEAIIDTITRAVVSGEKVTILDFGVFEKRARAARTARNPATGAAVNLKATSVPKFRPAKHFKDVVSGAKKP